MNMAAFYFLQNELGSRQISQVTQIQLSDLVK